MCDQLDIFCVKKDGAESPSECPDYQIFTDWQRAPRFSTIFTIYVTMVNTVLTIILTVIIHATFVNMIGSVRLLWTSYPNTGALTTIRHHLATR